MGLTTLGKLFDVQHKPFTALGFVMAVLIMIVGSLVWAAQLLLS